MALGKDRRDMNVPKRTTGRIPLLSISLAPGGRWDAPFGFGPVSIVCKSFIVEMS
jgi:hypothetical protein